MEITNQNEESIEKQKIITNLCLILDDNRILLGKKKRGLGEGFYNGYGGKVIPGETIEDSLVREVFEESGLVLNSYEKVGILQLSLPDLDVEMHIFASNDYRGELVETEEMAPEWFFSDEIPFAEMWQSDALWYPYFLSGQKFLGRVVFAEENSVTDFFIEDVQSLY